MKRRVSNGTTVVFPDGTKVRFERRLSRAQAIREALKVRRGRLNPSRELVDASVKRHTEFNFKAPRELRKVALDTRQPLVRIGTVPEIHYTSAKEGRKTHYVHFVKRPGMMYGHPDGKFFVIVGGSTRIRDWLYD